MSDKRGQCNVVDDEIAFCWGKKRGRGKDKEYQFYESFKFDGVEYSLHDSIYLFKVGESEPYVGKIIKSWEHSTKGRKVRVLWFFRPSEISNYLQGVDVLENELFLATGLGTGLVNVNPLEAIAGKCNVVCISKDERNQQPSIEELKLADYVFYRTFDVEKLTVSEKLDKEIATVDVKLLLNKIDPEPGNLAMLDGVNVAIDTMNPLISAKDNLVADRFIDHDTTIASSVMKADKLTRDFTALPKCHPEKLGAGVSDSTVAMVGVEEKTTSKKDARHIDGDVKCGTVLGSSLVKKEKHSIEKSEVSRPDNANVVPSTSKRMLKSDKKTTLKSPDLIQTKPNKVGEGGDAVTSPENGKSEPVNDVKKRIVTAGNFKSEDRLSKKLKFDGGAQKAIGNGGAVTQTADNVSPACNNVSEPGSAVETNVSGKLNKASVGLSDNPLAKQKYNGVTLLTGGKTSDKSDKALGKHSKEMENFVGKVSRERDGTSEGVSKRSNSLIEHKPNGKLGKLSNKQSNDDDENGVSNQVKEVTLRPLDRSKWFTDGSVEDRMKDAYDEERLVFLLNLDPTYTASEVENFVSCAFQKSCSVQMVQPTATSSPHSGQVFAIFNTRKVALKVIQKLERDCLMLPNGRPLVGFINDMSFPGKQTHFFGHLAIDKLKHQMQKDMREAVSTSHSTQPNTLEYEMALEWRLLQDRSDLWWKLLHQNQEEEIRKVKASLKSKLADCNFVC